MANESLAPKICETKHFWFWWISWCPRAPAHHHLLCDLNCPALKQEILPLAGMPQVMLEKRLRPAGKIGYQESSPGYYLAVFTPAPLSPALFFSEEREYLFC